MNIKFEKFWATYNEKNAHQLKDIDFEINEGDMLSIIGPSGAGKTTIFNAFFGDLITQKGSLKINCQDINTLKRTERKNFYRQVGFLSQETNLIPTDDVYTSIIRIYKFPFVNSKTQNVIFNYLKKFNMFEKIYTRIDELSGGQKQKVELIKLLLANKEVILADEPTSNLDPESSIDFLQTLKKLNSQHKITIITIMHDINLAQKFFSKFVAIKNGQMVAKGYWKDWNNDIYVKVFKK